MGICRILFFIVITTAALGVQALTPQLESALGIGNNSLNMSVNSGDEKIQYSVTNASFYFLNFGFNDFSFQVKFPYSDPPESRATRGDTKITDYQFAYSFNPSWKSEFYYQKYQGYYIEHRNGSLSQPNLGFEHVGGQIIYIFNPRYDPAMIRNPSWRQEQGSGSWILSAGLDTFDLEGELIPKKLNTGLRGSLQKVKVDSATLRGGYGYNWFWSRWFSGVAVGTGITFNQIHSTYVDADENTSNIRVINNFGISFGYSWIRTKVGLFARGYSWTLAFDDKEITSNTSCSGFYISSVF